MNKNNLKNLFILLALLPSILIAVSASALTKSVEILVNMETKANAVSVRSPAPVKISHYEIPLSLLKESREKNIDMEIYSSLVFKKNGQDYVRWIVNPEDTKYFKDVENFLIKHGLDAKRKTYFTGYQTASRSYIVEDPSGKVQFSIKTSTDQTGGNWTDKKQEFNDGFDIRLISDFLKKSQAKKPFKNIVIMQEPLTFGIRSLDQSIVVRELGSIAKSNEFIYVPGFSVMHEEIGRDIATRNGSVDPFEFWTENYVEPMARAAAEIAARTGIWYDSPHGQNFLVELDKNYKPTGRIVLRDLGDIYISEPIMKSIGEDVLLRKFSSPENISQSFSIAFGPLHGNKAPSWISQKQYDQWGMIFKSTLRKELANQTNITIDRLDISHSTRPFSYISTDVDTNNSNWSEYVRSLAPVKSCNGIYSRKN